MQEHKLQKIYVAGNNEDIIIDFLSKFFDPYSYRRSGRSTILAKAYIILAKRYPSMWIHPVDHHYIKNANEHLMNLIYDQIHKLNELDCFKFNKYKFMFIENNSFKISKEKNKNLYLQ